MIEEKDGFTRVIEFLPAFDKTDPDPKKDYGISDVEMIFALWKNGCGVEFSVGTNWHLPHVFKRRMEALQKDIISEPDFIWQRWSKEFLLEVDLIDLAHEKQEDDDWLEFKNFDWALGYIKKLYPEAKSVWYYWLPNLEDDAWDKFIKNGEQAMFEELEKIWEDNFGKVAQH